jgi:tetratricopeptide (TPR) repeat protein
MALADLASQGGEHAKAIQALQKAVEIDPADAITRYELGKEYLALEDFARAAGLFEQALASIRDNPRIWYNLGKARQKLGREAEAQEAYNQALALDPTLSRLVASRLGEGENTLQVLKELVARQPENPALRLQLAAQLRRQGELQEATQEIQRVLKSFPRQAEAWAGLAEIQLDQEEPARAEETLRKARAQLPEDGRLAYLYGKTLIRLENLEDAVPALELAAAHLPKPEAALRLLGNARYELKDFSGAIAALSRARDLDPQHADTWLDLGKAYYRNREYERAAASFQEARRLRPDYSWGGIWLGRALAGLKDHARAQAVYQEVMEKDPSFIQSYISLGDLAVRQNNPEAARGFYQRALQIDPFHQATKDKLDGLQ